MGPAFLRNGLPVTGLAVATAGGLSAEEPLEYFEKTGSDSAPILRKLYIELENSQKIAFSVREITILHFWLIFSSFFILPIMFMLRNNS